MEDLKRFVVQPSIRLFGGVIVDEKTNFSTKNNDGTVKQTLKNLVLTTKINKKQDDIYKSEEISSLKQELQIGTVLIWSEETGYIIPNYKMVQVPEAIERLEILKDIDKEVNDDTSSNEKENISAD